MAPRGASGELRAHRSIASPTTEQASGGEDDCQSLAARKGWMAHLRSRSGRGVF